MIQPVLFSFAESPFIFSPRSHLEPDKLLCCIYQSEVLFQLPTALLQQYLVGHYPCLREYFSPSIRFRFAFLCLFARLTASDLPTCDLQRRGTPNVTCYIVPSECTSDCAAFKAPIPKKEGRLWIKLDEWWTFDSLLSLPRSSHNPSFIPNKYLGLFPNNNLFAPLYQI